MLSKGPGNSTQGHLNHYGLFELHSRSVPFPALAGSTLPVVQPEHVSHVIRGMWLWEKGSGCK